MQRATSHIIILFDLTVTSCNKCCGTMQVTVCAVDPSSDQLTSIQLSADASLTDAAQMLGNALTEDDSAVNQYWVNLDPESQEDVIPRLPHGDPIFEINLVLLSARPGGKRCCSYIYGIMEFCPVCCVQESPHYTIIKHNRNAYLGGHA